jgi:hypothetical protein
MTRMTDLQIEKLYAALRRRTFEAHAGLFESTCASCEGELTAGTHRGVIQIELKRGVALCSTCLAAHTLAARAGGRPME